MKLKFFILTLLSLIAFSQESERDNIDPFEDINRIVFNISDDLDQAVLRPAAEFYSEYTPLFLKNGITNVFSNLSEVDTIVNQLLQGKVWYAAQDTGRFVINSTVGIAGFFDIASSAGLEKHDEDFGQTLGYWGVPSGFYLFVPFLGPTTLRDILSKPTSWFLSGNFSVSDEEASIFLNVLDVIETRERLLIAENLIVGDKYDFIRDAYLQSREYLAADGEIEDDFLTDLELDFFDEDSP
ncbi:MAG: VacJ family lipoprotein [Proteobacteria bacterium]|nr:VacJ family lipoprotein [Pseudomonadota bacterium]